MCSRQFSGGCCEYTIPVYISRTHASCAPVIITPNDTPPVLTTRRILLTAQIVPWKRICFFLSIINILVTVHGPEHSRRDLRGPCKVADGTLDWRHFRFRKSCELVPPFLHLLEGRSLSVEFDTCSQTTCSRDETCRSCSRSLVVPAWAHIGSMSMPKASRVVIICGVGVRSRNMECGRRWGLKQELQGNRERIQSPLSTVRTGGCALSSQVDMHSQESFK